MLTLEVEAPAEPLVEGAPRTLEARLRAGESVALLDEASFEAGRARASWRRRPRGVVSYDARADRYVHETGLLAVSAVPLSSGVLPPGLAAETFLAATVLEPGKRRLVLAARFREVAPPELASRLYLPPERGLEGASVKYELGRPHAARAAETPPGLAIVRESDLALQTARVEIDVEVIEDARSPGKRAKERGELVGRSRALGLAWIVAPRPGELEALLETGPLALGAAVPLSVLDFLDASAPGEATAVALRGKRAEEKRGELGLERTPSGARLSREEIASFLEKIVRERFTLRVGLPWEGVVVEDFLG